MRFAKHLMFVGLRFAILCSLLHLFGGVSTAQTTDDVTVANNTKPLSNEIGARRGNSVAQNSSPLTNKAPSTSDLAWTLRRVGSSQPTYSP